MTESNPFKSPESDVAPLQKTAPGSSGNKTVTYQTVPAMNGVTWILDGFKNFTTSPLTWSLVVFLYLLMLGTLSILPFVSIISTIIAPILMAGLMMCARENKYNSIFYIKNLFDGFRLNGGKLASLGALYFGLIILLFIVVAVVALILILGTAESFEALLAPNSLTPELGLLILLVLLIALSAMIPIIMAFWFAPALVIFHDVDIFEAVKLSFMGCIKNMMPYLIYSLAYIVIYFLAVIPIAILVSLMNSETPNFILLTITILVGIAELFIFTSVFFTSIFASYEDIFSTDT